MVKCEACEKEFESERRLHGHLKAHDLRMASYYQKYFPRKDWYNGEIIKFKSKEYYFDNDFNTRGNMQRWLKSKPLAESQEYCRSVIRKRIEKKKLKYTPSQVELRTIMSPPLQYYQVVLGDYYKMCKELGLKNKFSSIADASSFNPLIKKKIKLILFYWINRHFPLLLLLK